MAQSNDADSMFNAANNARTQFENMLTDFQHSTNDLNHIISQSTNQQNMAAPNAAPIPLPPTNLPALPQPPQRTRRVLVERHNYEHVW